jgi:hypothetical protein
VLSGVLTALVTAKSGPDGVFGVKRKKSQKTVFERSRASHVAYRVLCQVVLSTTMTGSKSEDMMCSMPAVFAMITHRTYESTSREQQQRTAEVIVDWQQ